LDEASVCWDYRHTAEDDKTYQTKYYNLRAITAVGYRVNSQRAIEFRKWATEILHEYIIKGFAVLIAKSALGIEAASFFEAREKDIAESPTFR
jgi:hypothetical protein